VRQNKCTDDGVCSEGVFVMAHRTRKFVVAAVKLDSIFITMMAIVAGTFETEKVSGNITGQLVT